jgi:putative transcriptional regulator
MLIAMPAMEDSRFARALIYMCVHSSEGAMGIVVNHRARRIKLPELLVKLEVIAPEEVIRLPKHIDEVPVLRGGPVETQRGFVLHSNDFSMDNTLPVGSGVSLTATVDILRAIARGEGPHQAILALGYAGWQPGQLEAEMQDNGWLSCAPDNGLLFDTDLDSKYIRALGKIGIDPAMLSPEAGHA